MEPEKLRFVWGVGRSGTTWVSRVLAASASTPLRYFQEPLPGLRPSLQLVDAPDSVAFPFAAPLDSKSRLLAALELLTAPDFSAALAGIPTRQERADHAPLRVVVKEVHALFAVPQIVNHFNAPSVVVVRDPIRCADSILRVNGIPDPYRYLMTELDSFAESCDNRVGDCRADILRSKLEGTSRDPDSVDYQIQLCVAVSLVSTFLQESARINPLIKTVRFEELCREPNPLFESLAHHLGIRWDESCIAALESLETKGVDSAYDTRRVRSKQIDKPLSIMSEQTALRARALLSDLGLLAH